MGLEYGAGFIGTVLPDTSGGKKRVPYDKDRLPISRSFSHYHPGIDSLSEFRSRDADISLQYDQATDNLFPQFQSSITGDNI